jgi:hypothetical protein
MVFILFEVWCIQAVSAFEGFSREILEHKVQLLLWQVRGTSILLISSLVLCTR